MPKWLAEVHLFLPSSSILWLNIILYNIPYTVDLTVHCTVQYYLYCTVHYTLHCTLSLLYKDIKVATELTNSVRNTFFAFITLLLKILLYMIYFRVNIECNVQCRLLRRQRGKCSLKKKPFMSATYCVVQYTV